MIAALVQTYNTVIAPLIIQGGPIVAILLVISVVAFAIILVKIVQFWMAGIYTSYRARAKTIDPVLDLIRSGQYPLAQQRLAKQRGPLARIIEAGLLASWRDHRRGAEVEAEIGRVGGNQLIAMQSYFRWLEIISNVGPLLGLLGTVMGMITAFQQLEIAGSKVDPAMLAGGIWEALFATQMGLMVAIPAVTVLNLLENRLDQYRQEMRDVSMRLMQALHAGEMRIIASGDNPPPAIQAAQ